MSLSCENFWLQACCRCCAHSQNAEGGRAPPRLGDSESNQPEQHLHHMLSLEANVCLPSFQSIHPEARISQNVHSKGLVLLHESGKLSWIRGSSLICCLVARKLKMFCGGFQLSAHSSFIRDGLKGRISDAAQVSLSRLPRAL